MMAQKDEEVMINKKKINARYSALAWQNIRNFTSTPCHDPLQHCLEFHSIPQ